MRVLLLLFLVLFPVGVIAAEPAEPPAPASPAKIAAWISELDSNRFSVRELATENLIATGLPSIQPVSLAAEKASLEVTARSILILRELALSDDSATENGARAALERLAAGVDTAASRRASRTLASLQQMWQRRALREIQRLGAKLNATQPGLGAVFVNGVMTIEIGPNWTGGAEGLRHLRWLTDVQQIYFKGEKVTDEWLAYTKPMPNLTGVSLKRTRVTDAGLRHLRDMPSIENIDLWYSKFTDAGLEHLKPLKAIRIVRIFGTQVTREGARELELALVGATVDWRRGAFLGVGGDAVEAGFQINYVHSGSAAEKAGFVRGDIIVKYGGTKVVDFAKLTELIGQHGGGNSVRVEILRNGRKIAKDITLGEWE